MYLFHYVPASAVPLVRWLLVLAIIAAVFSYGWPLIASIFSYLPSHFFPRFDWNNFWTVLIGEGCLAYLLATGAVSTATTASEWSLWMFVAAGVLLFALMIVNLYEAQIERDRGSVAHPKLWLLFSLVFLILWISVFIGIVYDRMQPDFFTARIFAGIEWLWTLPLVAFAVALLGVIILLPLLMQAVFAVPGVFESFGRRTR